MSLYTKPSPYQVVDRETWPREEHFRFFTSFQEPFFSITAEVDCTSVVERSRKNGESVTFALWHGVLKAANGIEEFRSRIKDGEPILYDVVHLSPTVLREDRTFTVAFVPYLEDRRAFAENAAEVVNQAKRSSGFSLGKGPERSDLIHFSTVPWFRFTSITHARPMVEGESEPKITIGKFGEVDGRLRIPVSITGHHGLMDGLHVGEYLQGLEEIWGL